jgi:hypothetical protein
MYFWVGNIEEIEETGRQLIHEDKIQKNVTVNSRWNNGFRWQTLNDACIEIPLRNQASNSKPPLRNYKWTLRFRHVAVTILNGPHIGCGGPTCWSSVSVHFGSA